ncbi:amidohydrolase family protein [Sulfitobacter albidus]|nr:amidohydrolase family protein [Sulfitobacter albidus]
MLAGRDEFPLWDGRVENPAPGPTLDGWIALLEEQMEALGVSRVVLVHSIFYGTDNAVTKEALARLGTRARGVGLLPTGVDGPVIDRFQGWGMDAVRLNYVHGGVLTWEGAQAMAPLLADRGMHIQMLCHADQHMDGIADEVRALPCPIVFDHLAWPSAGLNPAGHGIDTLCELMAEGHAWVKLSGLYRLTNAPYTDTDALVAKLIAANPARCLWGSDWPHIMLNGAQMPRGADLLDAFDRVVPDDATRRQILCENPVKIYHFA